jgi:polysaccharide biosynthesis/export protein
MMQLHARRLAVMTLIGCSVAFGQVKDQTQAQTRDKSIDMQQSASVLTKDDISARIGPVPMEGPVNPDRYFVGPSDIFQLGLWGPFSVTYPVTVTPEGTIIIPTVGEVAVAGMKLSEAKIRVMQKIRTKYTSGDVTFTLLKPRSIIVTLRGSVVRQGQYVVTVVDRVEKLLSLGAAAEPSPTKLTVSTWMQSSPDALKEENAKAAKAAQVGENTERASMRNILLMRKNGDTVRVDIPKFYATGEDGRNPFLLDGDVVLVSPRNLSLNSVGVYGAVNAPGLYEWVEGDSLLSLIQVAQGVIKGSDLEHVMIQRVNDRGEKAGELQINLLSIQKGAQPDVLLQRGDRIIVPLIPDNRAISTVTVEGHVKKPGMYPIFHGRTKLSEILELVGGFQNDALLSGAFILRRDEQGVDLFGPQISLLQNIRSQQLTSADSAYFYLDMRTSRHPVLVDFVKLIQKRDTTQDVILRDEDLIYVPSDNRTVLVIGQVQKPGYVPFVPGMRYKDYVARAGGFSELAISGDTKVIKKTTLEWLDPSDTVIEPGDQIWVPKEYIKDTRQTWPMIQGIIAVVASVATTILIAIQVTK